MTGGLAASGRHIVDMSNNYCSAVNCNNRRKNCPGKSFFRFPKVPARLYSATVTFQRLKFRF